VADDYLTVDTHVLWWYITDTNRLSQRARQALRQAEQGEKLVLVPTLALGEILNIIRKVVRRRRGAERSLILQEQFAEVLLWLDHREEDFQIVPLTREILEHAALLALELENRASQEASRTIRDLRDLVFMATADLNNCILITRDREIRDSGLVHCLW
jgi:PIN domain nuclease of toxin-antitoxin system